MTPILIALSGDGGLVDQGLVRADPTGAATTGWEAVAGIGSVALGMIFFCGLVLMLGRSRRGDPARRDEIDEAPTPGRRMFASND